MKTPDHPPITADTASSPAVSAGPASFGHRAEEHDLWEFEAAEPSGVEPLSDFPDPVLVPLPVVRGTEKKQIRPTVRFATPDMEGVTKINLTKTRPPASTPSLAGQRTPGQDFEDLDSWEAPPQEPFVIRVHPDLQPPSPSQPVAAAVPAEGPSPAAATPTKTPPASTGDITLWQLISRVNFSFFEYCGLFVLLGLLTAGGIAIYVYTLHRLPSKSAYAAAAAFPVQGEHLAVVSASSFWRAPGPGDTARRGTQLLPVLTFKSTGGPASIRVFFRDGDGNLIGDAVTQPMKSDTQVEISATAGFEDRGMYAAYRTNKDAPWTIEICEAPAGKFIGADFKNLLTLPVSTLSR